MKRFELEKFLHKKVIIKLFDGDTKVGFLQKSGDEKFITEPNLYYPRNYYFLTPTPTDTSIHTSSSYLFRASHVKKMKEVTKHKAERVDNLMYEGYEPHWHCKICDTYTPFHCYTKKEFEQLECITTGMMK